VLGRQQSYPVLPLTAALVDTGTAAKSTGPLADAGLGGEGMHHAPRNRMCNALVTKLQFLTWPNDRHARYSARDRLWPLVTAVQRSAYKKGACCLEPGALFRHVDLFSVSRPARSPRPLGMRRGREVRASLVGHIRPPERCRQAGGRTCKRQSAR
jgi:hypothetical protein